MSQLQDTVPEGTINVVVLFFSIIFRGVVMFCSSFIHQCWRYDPDQTFHFWLPLVLPHPRIPPLPQPLALCLPDLTYSCSVLVSLSSVFVSGLAHHSILSVPFSVSFSHLSRSAFVFVFFFPLNIHFHSSQSNVDDVNVSQAPCFCTILSLIVLVLLTPVSLSFSVSLTFTHTQRLIHPQVFFLPVTLNKANEVSELKGSKTNYWHSTGDIPKGSGLFDTQPISFVLLHDWQRWCLITQECLEAAS